MNNSKTLFIIDCYVNNHHKIQILKQCIESIKKTKIDILIVSHCTLPAEIVSMVDYHIFDKDNEFNEINFHTTYTSINNLYHIEVWGNPDMKIKSHEYPIIKSIKNALGFAKILGYETFVFSEYDNIFNDNDINNINQLLLLIENINKKFIVFQQSDEAIETIFFAGNINEMFDIWNNYFPKTIKEYNEQFTYTYPYSLEVLFWKAIESYKEKGLIINKSFLKYFDSTNKNLSRINSVSIGIVPNKNNTSHFLYVWNKDSILYYVKIYKDNILVEKEFGIIGDIIPALELYNNCDLYVEFYTQYKELFEVKHISFDVNQKELYEQCGFVLLK